MGLDFCGVPCRCALDDVSDKSCSWTMNGTFPEPQGFRFEHQRMNVSPIRRRLVLRVRDLGQRAARNRSRASTGMEAHAHVPAERLHHLVGLALPHEPVVDVDAGELVSNRLVNQGRGHGRVDATAEGADGPLGPYLFTESRQCSAR